MASFAAAPDPRGQTEDLEATAQRPTTRPLTLTIPVGHAGTVPLGSGWTPTDIQIALPALRLP
jgi:hypothetical protein